MSEILETLLGRICRKVTLGQQNAQQRLYLLQDAAEAKLTHELLLGCHVDAKYFADADGSGGRLYVQQASLADASSSLEAALSTAHILKQVKTLLDEQTPGASPYQLSFVDTDAGPQLTLLLKRNNILNNNTKNNISSAISSGAPSAAAPVPASQPTPRAPRIKATSDEEAMLAGPAVARPSLPHSKKSLTEEDSLTRRCILYLRSHVFTSVAWSLFFLLVLGVIFSILITIRGFLCPDLATDARSIPAYCPKKTQAQELF